MKKWMVFDCKMDCVGVVVASDYNDAWSLANHKYRNVDYISPM